MVLNKIRNRILFCLNMVLQTYYEKIRNVLFCFSGGKLPIYIYLLQSKKITLRMKKKNATPLFLIRNCILILLIGVFSMQCTSSSSGNEQKENGDQPVLRVMA